MKFNLNLNVCVCAGNLRILIWNSTIITEIGVFKFCGTPIYSKLGLHFCDFGPICHSENRILMWSGFTCCVQSSSGNVEQIENVQIN